MVLQLKPRRKIIYPESDGKPMAETDIHRDWMVLLIELLKLFFSGQQVYISGNLLVYYVKGKPQFSFSPDVFVVKGIKPGQRRVYKIWVEKKVPNFVLETTSKSTKSEDLGSKWELYSRLGIPEYFLYDPLGEWLDPPLQGYRLVNGDYEPIEPDRAGGIVSQELGITFRLKKGQLLLYNTATGRRLQSKDEQLTKAKALAKKEAAARRALEEELARLRAEQSPRGRSSKANGDQR
jgi:Uma2 family endonuclease